VLAQSGGMFLHLVIGKPGACSRANIFTTAGAPAESGRRLLTVLLWLLVAMKWTPAGGGSWRERVEIVDGERSDAGYR
jgi:hypothetical protein